MPKKRRISRKFDVAINSNASVIPINEYKTAGVHIGVEAVAAVFPLPSGKIQRIVFEYHTYEKSFVIQTCQAYWYWGADKEVETRSRRGGFILVFLEFLLESRDSGDFHLQSFEDVSEAMLTKYIAWLNKRTKKRGSGKSKFLAPGSKKLHFESVTNLLKTLKERKDLSNISLDSSKIIDPELFPINPFKSSEKNTKNSRVLSPNEIAKIEAACLKDMNKSWNDFAMGQELAVEGLSCIPVGCELYPCRPEVKELKNSEQAYDAYDLLWYHIENNIPLPDITTFCEQIGVSVSTARKGRFLWKDFFDEFYLRKPLRVLSSIYFPHQIDWDLRALQQLVVYLIRYHQGLIPDKNRRSDELSNFIKKANVQGFKDQTGGIIGLAKRCLYATPEVIVPYVVLLTSRGFFNPDTVLPSPRNLKKAHPLLPKKRTLVHLLKKRSRKAQNRSFSNTGPKSIDEMLEQVLLITEPLLEFMEASEQYRLFIFQTRQNEVSGFGNELKLGSASSTWQDGLTSFIKRNGLSKFTLRDFRSTGSDRAHELTQGDYKASQRVLGHSSVDTTRKHYRSQVMRKRDRELVAKYQGDIVTWSLTDNATGKPNNSPKKPNQDDDLRETQEAVTTGSRCKNPRNSPFAPKGTMCEAWLGCLGCHNATVFLDEPKTVAELMQLKNEFLSAKERIDALRFSLLYQEKLDIIEYDLLGKVTDENVISKALKILPTLPPIPEIE
ncbi:MAG: hypothetical protein KUG78_21905 [Kangiellaceae bacterium]|nr:hypothetical protein [Kangiellaceae bacterium]